MSMGTGDFWPPELQNLGSDRPETQIFETCPGTTPHAKYGWDQGVGGANAQFVTSSGSTLCFFVFLSNNIGL